MSGAPGGWADGDAYEAYMGRWSRALAKQAVPKLSPTPGMAWLDVGCGTGALTSALLELADPGTVVACDPSDAFVAALEARIDDPRVEAVVASAADLPQREGGFDRVVSGLVLNFIPDPVSALKGMRDRIPPDGIVAAYVWDYAEGMEFLRIFWDEARTANPSAAASDEGAIFNVSTKDGLRHAFEAASLAEVTLDQIEIATIFENFNDYWEPLLGATGPAPSYVACLDASEREALKTRLQDRLGEGRIHLSARAWLATGTPVS